MSKTIIRSNGSKWAGEEPDTIETLCDRLQTHPLDKCFEDYGNFIVWTPRIAVQNGEGEWIGGEPLYPGEGMVSFFGNFATYSHVFSIDTNDLEIIERLTRLIRANQQRPDYATRGAS